MRHTVLPAALLAAAVASSHAAPFIGIEYSAEEKRATGQSGMSAAASLGYKAADQAEYSVKAGFSQHALGHGEAAESVEAQVKKPFFATAAWFPYAAAGVGEKFSAADHYSYYFVDAGMNVRLTARSSLDVGSHSVNAFDPARKLYSTRFHTAMSWRVGGADSIGLRYSKSYGMTAQEKDAWRVAYTHSF